MLFQLCYDIIVCIHRKRCITSENQFDFLKDLVANVPDLPSNEEERDGEPKPKRSASCFCHNNLRPNVVDKKVLIFVFKQCIFSQNISEFGHYLYCHLAIHRLYQVLEMVCFIM